MGLIRDLGDGKMSKAMKAYEVITNEIIRKLEEGVIPWRKPWSAHLDVPQNLVSRKPYRGGNIFLLMMQGYDCPFWLTFNQAKKLGGHVRKGETSTPVIYWNWVDIDEEQADGSIKRKKLPFLRTYRVFNALQCEGIKIPQIKDSRRGHDPIAAAEAIVDGMPNRPEIEFTTLDRACYSPLRDQIQMPKAELFHEDAEFYSTLFHEMGHSTGHSSRLNRPILNRHGDEKYSKEELIAEMTAAFLCAEAEILNRTLDNSAAYIASWIKVLKGDPKLVVCAAAQAQKAADFILDRKWGEKENDETEEGGDSSSLQSAA
jgi:antirestriction protein ArdC